MPERYDCTGCQNNYAMSRARNHNGNYYCRTCYNNLTHPCRECGELTGIVSDYCGACSQYVNECNHCGDSFYNRLRYNTYLSYVYCSDDCFNEAHPACDGCGEFVAECMCCEDYDDDFDDDDTPNARHVVLPTTYTPCCFPNRAFGIELETDIEVPCPSGWKMVHDGSVNGMEYILGPALGKDGYDRIISGTTSMSRKRLITQSCGFHLHMNARDLSEKQVLEFVKFCYSYQNAFYAIVPLSRLKSSYCSPLKSINTDDLESYLYEDTEHSYLHECKRDKYNDARYTWINAHSYYYRGTIENRLHSGTMNSTKVINWVELWLKLLEYTKDGKWIDDMVSGFSIFEIAKQAGVQDSTIEFYRKRMVRFNKGAPVSKSTVSYYET